VRDRSKIAVQHCCDRLVSTDGCYRASRHDLEKNSRIIWKLTFAVPCSCQDCNINVLSESADTTARIAKIRVLINPGEPITPTLPKPNDWPVPKFRPRRIAKKLFYFAAPEGVVGFWLGCLPVRPSFPMFLRLFTLALLVLVDFQSTRHRCLIATKTGWRRPERNMRRH
jgi:hypothetical protein